MVEYEYEYLLFEYYSNTELFAHLCSQSEKKSTDVSARFSNYACEIARQYSFLIVSDMHSISWDY